MSVCLTEKRQQNDHTLKVSCACNHSITPTISQVLYRMHGCIEGSVSTALCLLAPDGPQDIRHKFWLLKSKGITWYMIHVTLFSTSRSGSSKLRVHTEMTRQ